MTMQHRILDFIQSNLAVDDTTRKIDERTRLLDEGIIDSMGLMQLRMFIEDQIGVRIPDEEVMPDNFETLASIEEMVRRLRSDRQTGIGLTEQT